jgi:hypothetical protein
MIFGARIMRCSEQVILIVTFLAFSWLAMQAVHELGHTVGAWLTGAEVIKVALHPGIISRTDMGHNPHPLLVVWAGPVMGAVLPLLAFLVAKACRFSGVYLFRFFAGFCLLANGVYIALGPAEGAADTGVMMQHGTPHWAMFLFGILTVSPGLYLWHGQGKHFGLGEAGGKVNRQATIAAVLSLTVIVGMELIFNSK